MGELKVLEASAAAVKKWTQVQNRPAKGPDRHGWRIASGIRSSSRAGTLWLHYSAAGTCHSGTQPGQPRPCPLLRNRSVAFEPLHRTFPAYTSSTTACPFHPHPPTTTNSPSTLPFSAHRPPTFNSANLSSSFSYSSFTRPSSATTIITSPASAIHPTAPHQSSQPCRRIPPIQGLILPSLYFPLPSLDRC